mmetsp:Transcript_38873/g.62977  ORF Transcript_38873/g.62977 Transcript_38873/m.62977 type:complete len:206 (-) Transcript_38873:2806-3423(-)
MVSYEGSEGGVSGCADSIKELEPFTDEDAAKDNGAGEGGTAEAESGSVLKRERGGAMEGRVRGVSGMICSCFGATVIVEGNDFNEGDESGGGGGGGDDISGGALDGVAEVVVGGTDSTTRDSNLRRSLLLVSLSWIKVATASSLLRRAAILSRHAIWIYNAMTSRNSANSASARASSSASRFSFLKTNRAALRCHADCMSVASML